MNAHLHTLYAMWLAASGWIVLAIAWIAWTRRQAPGAKALVFLCLSLAQWTLTYALHWATPVPAWQEAWLNWSLVGVVFSSVAVWLLVLDVTRPGHRLTPVEWAALVSVGAITTLMLALGDPGGLLLGNPAPGLHDRLKGGPWFTIMVLHNTALVYLSGFRLIQYARRGTRGQRRQALIMLVALGLPSLSTLLGVFGIRAFPDLEISPFLFLLTAALMLWAVLGKLMFDVVPIARHQLVEQMRDGVLVLDNDQRVVDLNAVARRSSNPDFPSPLGAPVREAFSQWSRTFEMLAGPNEQQAELDLGDRQMDVQVTPLFDSQQRPQGRIVVWRDVTQQRKAEKELQRAHAELQRRMADIEALQVLLREQSIRDPLTGLYNRRHIAQVLAEQVGQPFSVVLLDIDHFKAINDTFGHPGGDEALKQVSRILSESLKGRECVSRYGGEEFLVFLPGVTLAQATERAEGWRAAIAGQMVHYHAQQMPVTVSLGVAYAPSGEQDMDAVLLRVDQALYAAKHAGRNRVVAAQAEEGVSV